MEQRNSITKKEELLYKLQTAVGVVSFKRRVKAITVADMLNYLHIPEQKIESLDPEILSRKTGGGVQTRLALCKGLYCVSAL